MKLLNLVIRAYPFDELERPGNYDLLGVLDGHVVAFELFKEEVDVQMFPCQVFQERVSILHGLRKDHFFRNVHDVKYFGHEVGHHVRLFRNVQFFVLFFFLELVLNLFFNRFLKRIHKVDVEHVQVGSRLEVCSVLDYHDRKEENTDALDGFLGNSRLRFEA